MVSAGPNPVSPALSLSGITLTYANGVRALDGISLEVPQGEFLAIIGPNGSGKSSLLRVMAGLHAPDGGGVRVDGTALDELSTRQRAQRIAWVPQALEAPAFSVEDFVLLGRYAHLSGWRLFGRKDREIARECLQRVDAIEFLDRGMDELSGGERQRVLIARALAQEARTVLLDEPTSALDLRHQVLIYRLIHDLRRSGRTIVAVTHDLNLASQFAQRLLLLDRGKAAADGSPQAVLCPEVLSKVYGAELAYGVFDRSISGESRPWVLPWAKA